MNDIVIKHLSEVTPTEAVNMIDICIQNQDEQNWPAIEKMFRHNFPKANYYEVVAKCKQRIETSIL